MAFQLQAISAATGPGELVAAAAEGNEDAWRALVDRFAPLVHGVARSFRLPRAEAEDVSQTVWLRLVEQLERLREPDRVGAWLASTTRHECLRTLRFAKRRVPLDDARVAEREDDAEPVDARLLRVERDEELRGAYDGLVDRCRVLLRVVTDDPVPSYAQVAATVGISPESVGPIRSRCLAGLRRSLEGDSGARPSSA
jgi:RNA polymerase sigma factor (sigma-70 family)